MKKILLAALLALAPSMAGAQALPLEGVRLQEQASAPSNLVTCTAPPCVGIYSPSSGGAKGHPVWVHEDASTSDLLVPSSLVAGNAYGTYSAGIVFSDGSTSTDPTRFVPTESGAYSWYDHVTSFPNTGSSVTNTVRRWGWNVAEGAGAVDPTKSAISDAFESNFCPGARCQFERHIGEVYGLDGGIYRPYSALATHTTPGAENPNNPTITVLIYGNDVKDAVTHNYRGEGGVTISSLPGQQGAVLALAPQVASLFESTSGNLAQVSTNGISFYNNAGGARLVVSPLSNAIFLGTTNLFLDNDTMTVGGVATRVALEYVKQLDSGNGPLTVTWNNGQDVAHFDQNGLTLDGHVLAISYPNLGTATTAGLVLENTTASGGGQQRPPELRLLGHGFGGADVAEGVDFQVYPDGWGAGLPALFISNNVAGSETFDYFDFAANYTPPSGGTYSLLDSTNDLLIGANTNVVVGTNILPITNGGALGSTLKRWSAFATNVNMTGSITFGGTTFASLGTPSNGVQTYCTDCVKNSDPCAGAGTGAMATREGGAWVCR